MSLVGAPCEEVAYEEFEVMLDYFNVSFIQSLAKTSHRNAKEKTENKRH
jgi:hypothetical protein